MNKRLAIIGAGGHGKVIGEIALLNQYEIINFFESDIEIAPENSKNSEQNRLDLDSHLAKGYFSWETSLDLHETVKRTAFWYKSFLEGENALVLMVNEINDFISKK
jgi:hypothetical protein